MPGALEGRDAKGTISWSPDRAHFFFITRRGFLACDCNAYELHVFQAADLRRVLTNRHLREQWQPLSKHRVQFSAARSDMFLQPITRARWDGDTRVVFNGIEGNAPNQLYQLDVATGKVQQLTHGSRDVAAFAGRNAGMVYLTTELTPYSGLNTYPATAVTDDELLELTGDVRGSYRLYSSYDGGPETLVDEFSSPYELPWISPSGEYAVMAFAPGKSPAPVDWDRYEIGPSMSASASMRFMLIDVRRATMRPLMEAPTGRATRSGWGIPLGVLWNEDETRAIVINSTIPLASRDAARDTAYVLDVDVSSGEWTVVDALPKPRDEREEISIGRAYWKVVGRTLALPLTKSENGERQRSTVFYTRRGKGWTRTVGIEGTMRADPAAPGIKVSVRQSANAPPIVVASDGKHEIALTSPDSSLEGIRRADQKQVSWLEPDGRKVTGGLMLPRRMSPSARAPLVIQAYYNAPDVFLPDGTASTAFAAQALASAGMAVLFIDIPAVDADPRWRAKVTETVQEGVAFVARIDSAVESLAKTEPIDAAKVGLIGFSRSGFNTYYALTHPGRIKLAAAIVADAWLGSYGDYVVEAATSAPGDGGHRYTENYLGGGTFWQNKLTWMEHASGFNVDRVQAPVLFSTYGKVGAITMLETVGAFRINRLPMEYEIFPRGSHQLQLPRERLAAMTSTVDWMSFWLMNKHSAPADRLARWQSMKDAWEKRKASAKDGRQPGHSSASD